MKTNSRSSNLELLRILATVAIIMFHICIHCIWHPMRNTNYMARISSEVFTTPRFYTRILIPATLCTLGHSANIVFMMISGYFLMRPDKDIDLVKITAKLLKMAIFATVFLVFLSTFYISYYKERTMLAEIGWLHTYWWYVGHYFLVITIMATALKKFLLRLTSRQYVAVLLVMFGLTQFRYITMVFGNRPIWLFVGIFAFSLGGYIALYNPFQNIKLLYILTIVSFIYMLLFISQYNINMRQVYDFLIIGSKKRFVPEIIGYDYANIESIVLGVSAFELFRRLKIPRIRLINSISGGGTNGIYDTRNAIFSWNLEATRMD